MNVLKQEWCDVYGPESLLLSLVFWVQCYCETIQPKSKCIFLFFPGGAIYVAQTMRNGCFAILCEFSSKIISIEGPKYVPLKDVQQMFKFLAACSLK